MIKNRACLILGIIVISSSILFCGCGKKEDKSPAEKIEEAADTVSDDIGSDAKDDAAKEDAAKADVAKEDVAKEDVASNDDTLVGLYTFHPGDNQEDCTFEIFRVSDRYYIEYTGEYDYAGAELQINRREDEENCTNYSTTLYAFSGFSFMGDYWGKGNNVQIKAYQNGDVVLSKGQPFLERQELLLKRADEVCVHVSQTELTENVSKPEVIGTWRCVSKRDGDAHEITMVFSKDGMFRAVDKVKEQPPAIYVGKYTFDGSESDSAESDGVGNVQLERFAYGGMPDEWVLKYDEEGKHPYVYSDYMYAEPFTFLEGDDMKLPFEKVSDSEKSSIAQGPGSRASEVQEMFLAYFSGTDELTGVWQLQADTPAGDPYIFEIEIDEDGHASYCGYSMTGNNWFQNFCYDGMVYRESIDGSFDIRIEASELDENGTEIERISCEYNVKISDEKDSAKWKHISGQYIGFDETEDAVTFVKADKATAPGDSVTESQLRMLE